MRRAEHVVVVVVVVVVVAAAERYANDSSTVHARSNGGSPGGSPPRASAIDRSAAAQRRVRRPHKRIFIYDPRQQNGRPAILPWHARRRQEFFGHLAYQAKPTTFLVF